MELNCGYLPRNIVEAFKDVSPIDEINKFLVGFDKASECEYLPHLKNEDSLNFIDIPKDKMLFGEICTLSHGDCGYELMNPCYDYFCERLFGSLFDLDFLKVNQVFHYLIDVHYLSTTGFTDMRVTKRKFRFESHEFRIFILSWPVNMTGDPRYFVMNKDILSTLCNSIFEESSGENFSNYLCSRVAEYLYETNVPDWISSRLTSDISTYINEIVDSRHFDEYHWWEVK